MVAPRISFEIQNYMSDHIDEINNFGPRMKSVLEEQQEHDVLELNTQIRLNAYVANSNILFRQGLTINNLLYHVEVSFLDEMEHILSVLEPDIPSENGNRVF
jgi:hypothetical protein